jgi:lysophospholipase L1-like esterase
VLGRGSTRIAGVLVVLVAAAGCLALLLTSAGTPRAAPAGTRSSLAAGAGTRNPGVPGSASSLAGCEQALRSGGQDRPTLVVVGASFTAGVGPGNPAGSWAVLLARRLGWNAVVYGIPGAGYVRTGANRNGPVAAELARLDLRILGPALVIVQAGHNDIGVPPRLERQRVAQTVSFVHAKAPKARIALLTVFAGRSSPSAAYRTDRAIVTTGTATDRQAIIMDPLTGRWRFPHVHDGLHPTAAGSEWLAGKVAGILLAHGVRPAPEAGGTSPIVCDAGVQPPRSGSGSGTADLDGSQKRISVPPPAAASARTLPPWLSATWRTMDSPSPLPGTPLADGAR